MKKLIVILQFMFLIPSANAQGINDIFTYVNTKSPEDDRLAHARYEAVKTIQLYIEQNSNALRNSTRDLFVYQAMSEGLHNTPLTKRTLSPAPANSNMCDTDNNIAVYIPFIPIFNQVVRICNLAKTLPFETLVQIFIHESYHLAEGINGFYKDPVDSEVNAISYEMPIVEKEFGCTYFDYAYFNKPPYSQLLRQKGVSEPKACK